MKKVTIAGAGALGSHLCQFLRNEDIKLTIIDFDLVEKKNTLSQFHSKNSIRKNKTQSLQKTMDFLFGLKVEALPRKIQDNNVDALLSNANLIIDCLDNYEARNLVQTFVRKNNIPCLHGGVAAGEEFGRVIWDEYFVIDAESNSGAATCEDGEFLPFLANVSAHLAQSVQAFLRSNKKINWQISQAGTIRI